MSYCNLPFDIRSNRFVIIGKCPGNWVKMPPFVWANMSTRQADIILCPVRAKIDRLRFASCTNQCRPWWVSTLYLRESNSRLSGLLPKIAPANLPKCIQKYYCRILLNCREPWRVLSVLYIQVIIITQNIYTQLCVVVVYLELGTLMVGIHTRFVRKLLFLGQCKTKQQLHPNMYCKTKFQHELRYFELMPSKEAATYLIHCLNRNVDKISVRFSNKILKMCMFTQKVVYPRE